jgi:hypothetical protein
MIRLGEAAPALQTLRQRMCRPASPSDDISRTALHEHFARLAHGAGDGMDGAARRNATSSGGPR